MNLWIHACPTEFAMSEIQILWHMRIKLSGLIWNIWVGGDDSHTYTSQRTDQTTSGYPIIILLMYCLCFSSLLFSHGGWGCGLFKCLFSLTVRQLKANICSALRWVISYSVSEGRERISSEVERWGDKRCTLYRSSVFALYSLRKVSVSATGKTLIAPSVSHELTWLFF